MLVNIALDLQIIICTLLHPSDILALRKTCKTLERLTRQRIVWLAALHRVCFDNALFLPSFPIPDMSNMELERAAMAPSRWIGLCNATSKKQHPDYSSCPTFLPRRTRIIENSLATAADDSEIFIVPGGRYMLTHSSNGTFLWDLGYTSSASCKLMASLEPEGGPGDDMENRPYSCLVQSTPDGMGLIIFTSHRFKQCSIYEIYPQSETPQLTRIAHLVLNPLQDAWAHLLPDKVIWRYFRKDSIVFNVWDYRMNHSISFSVDVDQNKMRHYYRVIAMKTAIIIVCLEEIFIWAIPPLSPQPPDFSNHDPTRIHIPSLFSMAFPDGIRIRHTELVTAQYLSDWYCGSSQPFYFNFLCEDAKVYLFELVVKPDLFDTSLNIINTELILDVPDTIELGTYNICGDTLVACYEIDDLGQEGVYTWSRFTGITAISHDRSATRVLFSPISPEYRFFLCPVSGRYVYLDTYIHRIFVVDLF